MVAPLCLAEIATVTGDVRVDSDPIPHMPAFHTSTELRYNSSKLVPGDEGVAGKELPLVDVLIGPTEATCFHTDDHFARGRHRIRQLLDRGLVDILYDDCSQDSPPQLAVTAAKSITSQLERQQARFVHLPPAMALPLAGRCGEA
jgi:hypothetical protein